ncbi:unnamed protein product [Paramecium pentaurelia]|uniref:Protein kinase domain-containing protein n=1 Tax=Paramecium pentaurelia TaxID=43138 RepID=A0A8S1SV41_9CILI|nr:unnamed protein product [Paramecium pentaurelia]
MSKYKIKFRILETNSGTLYQIEEENGQNKQNFYAFDLSPDFQEWSLKMEEKLSNCNTVRQHVKQINYQNQRYILFTYLEGITLDRQISNFRGKKESIKLDILKNYLTQSLETLYQIHNQYILGRVFSTKNILDCDGQILFLDFGFGPKMLTQNIDLIFPPEIIEKYVEKQQYDYYYDIKIDSWLLGAMLFHLVKLKPINAVQLIENKVKIMSYNDINEYWLYLKKQMERSNHIDAFTERYPKELCQFIQGLLTYNPINRLSFHQIYKNDFIKSLNLPKYEEYLQFYENYNEKKLDEEIKTNEISASVIIMTKDLQIEQHKERSNQNVQTPQTSCVQEYNKILLFQIQILQVKLSMLHIQFLILLKDQQMIFLEAIKIILKISFVIKYRESKFYVIWSHIKMELFRQTFLEKISEEFAEELKKKNFQLENVLVYFLRKMGYLILVELLKKINQDVCPWKCAQEVQQKWKDFKIEDSKKLLENSIKSTINKLEPILKETFIKHCQIYQTEEKIEEVIRNQLKADQNCFLSQKIDGDSIFNCSSEDFLRNGYRQFIQITSKFLEREKKLNQQPSLKYNTLLLKILICHLINRIFNLNNVKINFENLLKDRKTLDFLTPHEIYQYICRDDETKKDDDIKHIFNVNFKNE